MKAMVTLHPVDRVLATLDFAHDLNLAASYTPMLIDTCNSVRNDLKNRLGIAENRLPSLLNFHVELQADVQA